MPEINRVAVALDSECKRVAKEEGRSMEDLISELAALTKKTPRMLYNYRSGKWPLPSDIISPLCKRFKSETLLQSFRIDLQESGPELGPDIDIQSLSMKVLKDVFEHHEALVSALTSPENIDRTTLLTLEQSTETIIRKERTLFSIVERAYEQQQADLRKRKA